MSDKVWIQKVSKERIRELAERIVPVVRFAEGEKGLFRSHQGFPYTIEPVDLWEMAYTWDPKAAAKVEKELVTLRDITTYHGYGHYALFKPSVAEVLAQIPEDLIDQVTHFEIVWSPDTAADLHGEAFNAGYHEAKTRLYVAKGESDES